MVKLLYAFHQLYTYNLYAFHQLFEQILDRHTPVKKVKIRSRPNPFITPDICELMSTRDKWKKLAHISNDPLAWAGFRDYKREVKCEIRMAEREFVRDQIKNNQNNYSGNLWKTIRSILPRKSSSCLIRTRNPSQIPLTNFLPWSAEPLLTKLKHSPLNVITILRKQPLSLRTIHCRNNFHSILLIVSKSNRSSHCYHQTKHRALTKFLHV